MKNLTFETTAVFFRKISSARVALIAMALLVGLLGAGGTLAQAAPNQQPNGSRAWVEAIRVAARGLSLTFEKIDLSSSVLDRATKIRMKDIAFDQAQVWSDTILEGDYTAESAVRLDGAELVRHNGELVAYRITYSSAGYYIGNCDSNDPHMKGCVKGRIVESTFVSLDLSTYIRDEDHYADFVAD